ncbi:hypothetical protein [Sphingobacterium hotanense]|uniref:hypothetical protein n=1 Tax=Sphingobacterium hotanense TaxID=649196 RepID=UPI0011F1B104|nr:hypothetical protein [Sphingobacterium hotanense]
MLESTTTYYTIADHVVKIVDHIGLDLDRALPSFRPFGDLISDTAPMLTFDIRERQDMEPLPARETLSDVSVIWLESFRFEESENCYFTSILAQEHSGDWLMSSEKDFSHSVIYPIANEIYNTTKLSWLIMVAFGQACLAHRTLLIHASVVENGEAAVAFLGKSGTGKSTHSRLWMAHNPNIRLLNDDNPAIRILEGNKVMVYGTPWSGKTHCYRNARLPLVSIIRLEQSAKNEIFLRTGMFALTALLPSGSAIRWSSKLYGQMLNNLEEILASVKVGHLKCLPNAEAAELSHSFAFERRM